MVCKTTPQALVSRCRLASQEDARLSRQKCVNVPVAAASFFSRALLRPLQSICKLGLKSASPGFLTALRPLPFNWRLSLRAFGWNREREIVSWPVRHNSSVSRCGKQRPQLNDTTDSNAATSSKDYLEP